MRDIFKKAVIPYNLYELQQRLLNAIGPQVVAKHPDWQKNFFFSFIHQPIAQYLVKDDFDEETPLLEKLIKTIPFLKDKTDPLYYCSHHISDDYLQRTANGQLSFLRPIWGDHPGFSKEKAFAAIRTLVILEIAYYFLAQIDEFKEDFPEKEKHKTDLIFVINREYDQFAKHHLQKTWRDYLSKYPNLSIAIENLQKYYAKSYLKKDLSLLFNLKNLWQQNIPHATFWRNLSWVSLRIFRLCALTLPIFLFYFYTELIVLLTRKLSNLLLEGTAFLKRYLAGLGQFLTILETGVSLSLSLLAFGCIVLGWPWFSLLASFQGIGLLFNASTLATHATGITAFMLQLTKLAGPLLWIGIPVGLISATLTFMTIGIAGSLLYPLKRALMREKLPSLSALKAEVVNANHEYYYDFAHARYYDTTYLTHPVYIDTPYQVCLTQEEITEIKRATIFKRSEFLTHRAKNYLQRVFNQLNKLFTERPFINKMIINPSPVENLPKRGVLAVQLEESEESQVMPLHFSYCRWQDFETFKQNVMTGLADHDIAVEEKPVPRL